MRFTLKIFTLLCFVGSPSVAETPRTLVLAGRVIGASGQHEVHVALWAADGFLSRPVREVKLSPQSAPSFRFEVAPGRWAVSAFEDRNDNGVLDMGLFGPKEPSGFWKPFHAWRKPRFDDVAVQLERDVTDADVTLK